MQNVTVVSSPLNLLKVRLRRFFKFSESFKHTINPRLLLNRLMLGFSYYTGKTKVWGSPITANIESTNFCNLECIMCPRGEMKRKLYHMKLEEFKAMIDGLGKNTEYVGFDLFGETLIHPQIAEMVKYCTDKGIRSAVSTNVTVLTEKKAKELLEAGLSIIVLSVDGATKETYEQVRQGGNYEDVLKNLNNFLRIKKEIPNKTFALIQLIEMNNNKTEVQNFLDQWDFTDVDGVRIKRFQNWAGQLDQNNYFYEINSEQKFKPCDYLWRHMYVFATGEVVPCCRDFDGKHVLGNAMKEPLEKIWNNEAYQKLRKMHVEGRRNEIPLCRNCDYNPSKAKIGTFIVDPLTIGKL
ncbi:MAG: radical SAM protein [archaeon]|nr:radical SAM protein [archaeon]